LRTVKLVLFLLYINYLPINIDDVKVVLFGYGTKIVITAENRYSSTK
jgi:hypothetical protein